MISAERYQFSLSFDNQGISIATCRKITLRFRDLPRNRRFQRHYDVKSKFCKFPHLSTLHFKNVGQNKSKGDSVIQIHVVQNVCNLYSTYRDDGFEFKDRSTY